MSSFCELLQIDYIAASFVRKASDVNEIKAYVKELMAQSNYPADHPHPKIISKIESTEVCIDLSAWTDCSSSPSAEY